MEHISYLRVGGTYASIHAEASQLMQTTQEEPVLQATCGYGIHGMRWCAAQLPATERHVL